MRASCTISFRIKLAGNVVSSMIYMMFSSCMMFRPLGNEENLNLLGQSAFSPIKIATLGVFSISDIPFSDRSIFSVGLCSVSAPSRCLRPWEYLISRVLIRPLRVYLQPWAESIERNHKQPENVDVGVWWVCVYHVYMQKIQNVIIIYIYTYICIYIIIYIHVCVYIYIYTYTYIYITNETLFAFYNDIYIR